MKAIIFNCLLLVLVSCGIFFMISLPAQENNPSQTLLDLVRSHVTNEATRIIAEVTEGLNVQAPLPVSPVGIESIQLRASTPGGHEGYEKQSLIVDVSPPHAMVQCVWEAWGGVQLFPGNRSAYLIRTPSGGDGVRVDCFGVLPYSAGRQFDELEWR